MIYPIGTQYLSSGKCPRLCTVVDVWSTFNSKGELVKVRYVSEHEFMGQTIVDTEANEVTIARGIYALQQSTIAK